MKHLYIVSLLIIVTLSCKAQTILPLGGPPVANKQDLPKPIFIKDSNNLRDNFYGIWQGTVDKKELTLYIYKIDAVPRQSLITDLFVDNLFGYYIYKENGEEIINSRIQAQNNSDTDSVRNAPIYGTPSSLGSISLLFFKDYNIEYQNNDGDIITKKGVSNITISDSSSPGNLQANFELKNIGEVLGPYNYDFSIPTDMVLTKIANTPPPLD